MSNIRLHKYSSLTYFSIMKKCLIAVLAAAVMFLSGNTAKAQGPMDFDPAQIAQMRVDQMKQSLKLTEDQSKKLVAIFQKEMDEMMKMFEGGDMPDMNAMQENRKKQDEEIKKILSEDQFKAYQEEQKKMMEQFGGGF